MIKWNFYRRLAANALLCCLCAGSLLVASDAQGRSIRWLPLGYGAARSVADNGTVVFSQGILLPDGTYVKAPGAAFTDWISLYDISADGRIVVGYVSVASGRYWPIIWRYPGEVERLLPWAERGIATGVSADGSTVVGYIDPEEPSTPYGAFRWRKGEQLLVFSSQLAGAIARAASSDGSVFVGYLSSFRGYEAFVCENGSIRELPTWGGRFSQARSVSADGSVIVGFATTIWVGTWEYYDYWRAAVWENGRLINVGALGRQESDAFDVSGDGRIVVGHAWDRRYEYDHQRHRWVYYTTNPIAFVWTPDIGIRPLEEIYADLLDDGSRLLYAYSISPNGRYIVGYGDAGSRGSSHAYYLIDTW